MFPEEFGCLSHMSYVFFNRNTELAMARSLHAFHCHQRQGKDLVVNTGAVPGKPKYLQ